MHDPKIIKADFFGPPQALSFKSVYKVVYRRDKRDPHFLEMEFGDLPTAGGLVVEMRSSLREISRTVGER